jgi:hypothetical protein
MPTIKHTLALHEVTKMHTSVVSVGITSGIGRTISGMTYKNSSKYRVKTTRKKADGDSGSLAIVLVSHKGEAQRSLLQAVR